MARSLLPLMAALALPALLRAQEPAFPGGTDEETGLWFPPGAPPEVYVDGSDPRHVYLTEVKKAFDADDELRVAACEWMISPRNEASARQVGPRIAQLRTMVQMLCMAVPMTRKAEEDRKRADAENERRWRAAVDPLRARALPPDEREERALELCARCGKDSDERMANALAALALRPSDEEVVAAVLDAHPFRDTRFWSRYVAFLKGVFAGETRDGAPEAARWRRGQRTLHFYLGELTEARDLTRQLLADAEPEDQVFLALLERSLGNPAPFRALLAECPVPAEPGEAATAGCWEVARTLAASGIRQLRSKAPRALADVLAESIAAEPTRWTERLESIRALAVADRPRGRAEVEALLRIPATIAPLETRLGAVGELAVMARLDGDTRRGLAAYDRYLDMLEFHPPAVPPDVFARLAAVPLPPGSSPYRFYPSLGRVRWALASKISLAVVGNDAALARRQIEGYAALAVTDPELAVQSADAVRHHLLDLARAELKAGRRAEAIRIAGFLYAQPHDDEKDGKVVTPLSSFRAELMRGGPVELKAESAPWELAPTSRGGSRRRPPPAKAPSGRP